MKQCVLLCFWCFVAVEGSGQEMDSLAAAQQIDSLIQANNQLINNREFEKAIQIADSIKKMVSDKFGENHLLYAASMAQHGNIFYTMGQFKDCEPYYVKSTDIRKSLLGKEHLVYIQNLYTLGFVYLQLSQFDKSEPLLLEVKSTRQKVLGEKHIDYMRALNALGILYFYKGNIEKSEYYFKAVTITCEIINGKQNLDYALSLNNLAGVYLLLSQYASAEPILKEAIKIWGELSKKESPEYALSVTNLGLLYFRLGQFKKSEPFLLEAKNVREITFGKQHPVYAQSLNNLSALYTSLGQYKKTEELLLEALEIQEKSTGKGNYHYVESLNNLGNLYYNLHEYEKAESIFLEELKIKQALFDEDHTKRAPGLIGLSNVYIKTGRYVESNNLLTEAKYLYEKNNATSENGYINTLANLSLVNLKLHNYSVAEKFSLEGIDSCAKYIGQENLTYIGILQNLSDIYNIVGKAPASSEVLFRAFQIENQYLHQSSAHLTQYELGQYLAVLPDLGKSFGSMAKNYKNLPQHLSSGFYNYSLTFKGYLLQSAQTLRRLMVQTGDSTNRVYTDWNALQRRLATQYTLPIAERKNIPELEARADSLEKILVRSVSGFADARRRVEWNDVQKALRPGEAAVEFVRFDYHNPEPTDSVLYAALVLRPGDEAPHFVTLFEKNDIAPLMQGVMGSNFARINATYQNQSGKTLYDLIWKPLEPLLQGINTVYCSPAGLLHRLNLGALAVPSSGNTSQTFADRHRLILLGSTRQLVVDPHPDAGATNTAYLAGGIRYSMDSTAIAAGSRNRGLEDENELPFATDSTARGQVWNYLPESAKEVAEIKALLTKSGLNTQLDTGYVATEENVRSLGASGPSPRVVHLSTHGFFFPDPAKRAAPAALGGLEEQVPFKISEHPMIRSGLLLAGANQAWTTGRSTGGGLEDGILTAYEISQMNLSATELVVLSACETGLGDIEGNEGVYGLQRAFKIAGAKYLIMSLWKVNDRSTREFMTAFYRQWLEHKQPIPDAFRAAQQALRAKYPDAPYHWAGFVLVE